MGHNFPAELSEQKPSSRVSMRSRTGLHQNIFLSFFSGWALGTLQKATDFRKQLPIVLPWSGLQQPPPRISSVSTFTQTPLLRKRDIDSSHRPKMTLHLSVFNLWSFEPLKKTLQGKINGILFLKMMLLASKKQNTKKPKKTNQTHQTLPHKNDRSEAFNAGHHLFLYSLVILSNKSGNWLLTHWMQQ